MPFDRDLIRRLAGRVELLTPDQMGHADRTAGAAGPALMEAAGRAVARAVKRHFAPSRVLVLAGPGITAATATLQRGCWPDGWPVRLAALAPPRAGPMPPGPRAFGTVRWPRSLRPRRPRADVVIDAVFGAGLTRPVEGWSPRRCGAARRVVAVDVPSGLDGATGRRWGCTAAELTVTFFRLKPGHLLLPGRDLCGRIELADIGIPDRVLAEIAPATFANLPSLWRLPC